MLFVIAQLFINFKRGMVFSPFYHYGMYSEVMTVKDSYGIFEIEVNGKTIKASDFSAQQWDNIILPLTWYSTINTKSNALYYTDIKRLMDKINVTTNEKSYLQKCDINSFERWYQSYLQRILSEDIATLNIRYHIFRFTSGKLQPTDSISSLGQLCN
jgi:hypothetical protein